MWERNIQYEIEEHIPDNELAAFAVYFAKAQREWDLQNPLAAGHRFPNAALQDRLLEYYTATYFAWEQEKSNGWMCRAWRERKASI